ncbi:MAG: isoprenylcysteine carboxylmethyltransferase family protein [Nitriliruptoraceae bacterium]
MMRRGLTGWLLVGVQAVLIVAVVLTPPGSSWPTPTWVLRTGWAISSVGAAGAIWAAIRLGDRLTPTPVPRDGGELRTDGPYAHVRHPIYSGVLLIVVGIAVRTGSALGLGLSVVTIGFFHAKAIFEEHLLTEQFAGYRAYAGVTPRFVPRPWRITRRD